MAPYGLGGQKAGSCLGLSNVAALGCRTVRMTRYCWGLTEELPRSYWGVTMEPAGCWLLVDAGCWLMLIITRAAMLSLSLVRIDLQPADMPGRQNSLERWLRTH